MPFQGFLITVGVPIAAWAGVFVADLLLRHAAATPTPSSTTPAAATARCTGRPYCSSCSAPSSAGAWSPTGCADWLTWQGYLLEPFGLGGKDGAWAFANLGVFVAFAVGFLGWLLLGRSVVARQESAPATALRTDEAVRSDPA